MYRDETNQQGGRKISKKEENKLWIQRSKERSRDGEGRRAQTMETEAKTGPPLLPSSCLHNNRLEPQPQQQHHHHRGEHRPRQERNAAETGRRQKSTTRGKPSLSSPVASASTTANQTLPPRRVASSSPSPSLNAVAGAALHCSRFKFSNILPGPTQFLKKK